MALLGQIPSSLGTQPRPRSATISHKPAQQTPKITKQSQKVGVSCHPQRGAARRIQGEAGQSPAPDANAQRAPAGRPCRTHTAWTPAPPVIVFSNEDTARSPRDPRLRSEE